MSAVTAAAMAAAAANALSLEYLALHEQRVGVEHDARCCANDCNKRPSAQRIARSSVSRPHCTMASASSAMGMRPEKPAAVYPYVTFAMSFRPNCFAFGARRRALASAGALLQARLHHHARP